MKKKILFIWPTLSKGGAEAIMLNLIFSLQCYFDITLLVKFNACEFQSLPSVSIIYSDKKKYTKFIDKLISRVFFYINIFRFVKQTDFVVCKEVMFGLTPSFFAAKILHKSFVVWNHSNVDELSVATNDLEKKVHKFILKNANTIVNVSKYAEKSLFNYLSCSLGHSLIIYNYISKTVYDKFITKLSLPPSNDLIKIVTVGRLAKEKNFELALFALHDLIELHKLNIKLIICGEGEQRSKIESIIQQKNLQDSVLLTGLVHNVIDYIQESHILISTSKTESFGITIVEAMLCHVPVIATNTGGANEILENGKYGYTINNKDELVNTIIEVINDYNLALEKAQLGYISLNRFLDTNIIEQWKVLFEEIKYV